MKRFLFLLTAALSLDAADSFDGFFLAKTAAKAALARPYDPEERDLPESLARMGYDAYRGLLPIAERRLWRGEAYQLGFFHRGGLARGRVRMWQPVAGAWREERYDPTAWTVHPNLRAELPEADLRGDIGFAGFRVWTCLNVPDQFDELISFIGASYFRPLGKGHAYGASCRGVGLRVTAPDEEFPRFSAFWFAPPHSSSSSSSSSSGGLRFAAWLDGPGIVGAYDFHVQPGLPTVVTVRAELTARTPQRDVMLAPLTSMFLWDGGSGRRQDFRPEVHDSDGLLFRGATVSWVPLQSPNAAFTQVFPGPMTGFGLLQRDRAVASYQDREALYHKRPGLFVVPLGSWPAGAVVLKQAPNIHEGFDSVNAGYVMRDILPEGATVAVAYEIRVVNDERQAGLLSVLDSCVIPGPHGVRGRIHFVGAASATTPAVVMKSSAGVAPRTHLIQVEDGWEVLLVGGDHAPGTCWSVALSHDSGITSEVWQHIWHP